MFACFLHSFSIIYNNKVKLRQLPPMTTRMRMKRKSVVIFYHENELPPFDIQIQNILNFMNFIPNPERKEVKQFD
jgi:hypothetical protein